MNKIILTGRLTADPEVRMTAGENGMKVANYRIAVPRSRNREEADFFNIVSWRGQAEFVEKYLRKGSAIAVVGTMQMRQYDRDGVRHTVYNVVADNVEFTYGSPRTDEADTETQVAEPTPAAQTFVNVDDTIDEEIPFN